MKRPSKIPPVGQMLILLSLVVLLINGYMVYLSIRDSSDLVRSDYYEHGLKHDELLAHEVLGNKWNTSLMRSTENWAIHLTPQADSLPSIKEAVLSFYRPSDKSLDFKVKLVSSAQKGVFKINRKPIITGPWEAHLQMKTNLGTLEKKFHFVL